MGRPSLTNSERALHPFRVLITCGVFEPGSRGGGPIRSVANIVDTAPDDVDVTLVTRDRDLGSQQPYDGLSGHLVPRGRSQVFYLDTGKPRQWLYLWRRLARSRWDLLYVNSLLDPRFTLLPVLAVRLRLLRASRILIAPRGELNPGALSLKARKKRIYLRFVAPLLRTMDIVWHASSEKEASAIKVTVPWARIVVNQDQVSLPLEPLAATTANQGPVRLVFIGRISIMKNLQLTLRALKSVARPAEFDIYGPIEDAEYWLECQTIISQLPAHICVRYRGQLSPSEVRQIFAAYDAFVLPTLGENFGHVIAESLSASCPVICSDETPWTATLESGGGTVVRDLTSAVALGVELERRAEFTPSMRFEARQAAGRAYRSWRKLPLGPNVLEEVRLAPWSLRK